MASLFYKKIGTGKRSLVLLHGWALNADIWSCITPRLESHFCLYLIDLPGYGRSYGYNALSLDQMAEEISLKVPPSALWLGWSLGGLVATTVAFRRMCSVSGLITVASSPNFCANSNWPGIKPEVLEKFLFTLKLDLVGTINRFISLQTSRTKSSRRDARYLKNNISSHPIPKIEILVGGLTLIKNSDLRLKLKQLNMPILHLYGYLDSFVPHTAIPLINRFNANSRSIVFYSAAHVPFISHPLSFSQIIRDFSQSIDL